MASSRPSTDSILERIARRPGEPLCKDVRTLDDVDVRTAIPVHRDDAEEDRRRPRRR